MPSGINLYRWLLKLYPAGFREEYGLAMERQFRDDFRDARGSLEHLEVWLSAIGDVLVSAPLQMLHEVSLDLRHAVRLYRKRWMTTALAVTALGLAIGLSTGVFSVLNAVLLRSLPFARPARLTELWLSPVTAMNGRAGFKEWSRTSPYLSDAATFSSSDMNLERGRDGFRVKAAETSANFFALLGVAPVAGRSFSADEDVAGRNAVAVISFGLWQQLFGGSRDVGGTAVRVNGVAFTVIGVAPASLDYPAKTNIWLPTVFDFEKTPKRGAFLFQTIGRLKEGVTIRQAVALFEAEVRRANPAAFQTVMTGEAQNRPRLASLQDQLAGGVRQASWVLAGLTLMTLLIACTNVAQLLLSRTVDRRPELELRAALGAGRARLLQQLITEALLLTGLGAVLGLLVARWTAELSASFAPPQLVTQQYTLVDWRVLTFAIALSIIIGVMFGVLPVWLLGRLQPADRASRPRPGNNYGGTRGVRRAMVAAQTAFAICLVSGSLSMGRTFLQLLHVDLGFRPANVVTLNVSLQGTRHSGARESGYYSEALQRLRTVAGVTAAGAVAYLPLATSVYMADAFHLDSGQKVDRVITNAVTPGYFGAMGTTFVAGRDLAENAGKEGERPVIVNEAFAKSTGLGIRIMGRKLIAPWNSAPYVVVGVVSTARLAGPAYPGGPQIHWPIEEEPPPALTLVASVQGQPDGYLAGCREAVRSVDSAVPVYDVETLNQRLAEALARPRFYASAAVFLGLLAVLLAAIGSYGTAAYSIAQRTNEMGIRMAVGASRGRIRAMILREGMMPILFGTAGGLFLSLVASRYLEHLLENASRASVEACLASGGFLLLSGALAVWSAGNRILSIDPAEALRAEA